jgi:hypothetical protein
MVKRWTEEENQFILKVYKFYTNKELAEFFGVKASVMATKVNNLGIKRKVKIDIPEGFKNCYACKKVLQDNFFHKNQSACKECQKEQKTEYVIRKKILEKNNIIKEFKEKNKDIIFFCNTCEEEKTINDFSVCLKKNNKIHKECLKCKHERMRNFILKRAKEKGY